MADQKTRADSIRMYLTGAGSDGGAQTDPDAALGDYRSSTLVVPLSVSIASAIANITVDAIAGANGTGAGSLIAASGDTLTWTPPGGSVGTAVTILNGETKIIEGADKSKFIRVSRTSATGLTGTATLTLTNQYNGVIGMDNVSSAEATAGDDEYRCFCVKNEHASVTVGSVLAWIATLGTQATTDSAQLSSSGSGTITTTDSFADWPESGYAHILTSGGSTREIVYYSSRTGTSLTVTADGRAMLGTSAAAGASDDTVDAVPGIRIAKEAPTGSASTGNAQTIADEDTAPTAVTFDSGITSATGLNIGDLAPGEIYFIWLHRETPAGAQAIASAVHLINFSFDAA